MILGDVRVGGQVHKALMHFDKNGFLYVLDRANGKLLAANPFTKVTWASHVDIATGRPVETAGARNLRAGNRQMYQPSAVGGKNWAHAAFNPKTGLLYVNTINMASEFEFVKMTEPYKPGTRWVGVKDHALTFIDGEPKGHMEAIEPSTGKAKWRVPLDYFNLSSMLATGSGLLFTGRHTGEFLALDADTGKQLWQFQVSSGVNASPVTWSHNGRQYVTVLAGLGGLGWRWMGDAGKNVPRGGSAWTFALPQ